MELLRMENIEVKLWKTIMIYCFDLDGTLCWKKGTRNNYLDSDPLQSRIDVVNELYEEGHTILIETARGSGSGIDWYEKTKNQLDGWGVKYNKLRTGTKLCADVFIDDKGISDKDFFDGKQL
jgi:hypothetical protein